jgi:hypothetical protein
MAYQLAETFSVGGVIAGQCITWYRRRRRSRSVKQVSIWLVVRHQDLMRWRGTIGRELQIRLVNV